MNKRTARIMAEWLIAVILVTAYVTLVNRENVNLLESLEALQAHQQSESSYHYGPSDIAEEVEFENTVTFLGTYKNLWFSANTVWKQGLEWLPGSGVGGYAIDETKKLTYSWSESQMNDELRLVKWYGYVKEPEITRVELEVEEPTDAGPAITILTEDIVDHPLFLFIWNGEDHPYKPLSLRGLDLHGSILFEEELR